MRYIEYVYLILAGMSFTFLVTEYDRLEGHRFFLILLSMGIFAFMFAFRRSQRKRFEAIEAERVEEIERELAEWAEEQDEAQRRASSTAPEDQSPRT